MVFRHNVKCHACDESHTLRVWFGHDNYQEHKFKCVKCGLDIKFAIRFDPYPDNGKAVYVENCEISADSGEIINLNPHFPHPKVNEGTEGFPWMEQILDIIEKLDEKGHEFKGKTGDIYVDLGGVQGLVERWKFVRTLLKLSGKGTLHKAEVFLNKHKLKADQVNVDEELWQFVHSFINPGYEPLFKEIAKELKPLGKDHKRELEDFVIYYWENLKQSHIDKYIEMFDAYTENYTEYGQLFLYAKNQVEPPAEIYATSINFDKVKMYYGTVYEILTAHIEVLACLNNIKMGRKFDQFERMNLSKYTRIDKANRANPFKENVAFSKLTLNLKSTLRNASHHNAIRLGDDSKTLEYRSGDTGTWKEMQYCEYLYASNEITLATATLLALELVFASVAPKVINKRRLET